MLIRQARLSLFLVLALLQCLAPLIHGHLTATDAEGVHMHTALAHQDGAHDAGHGLQAADAHGATIGVATTYKRDLIWLPVLAGLVLLLVLQIGSQATWQPCRTDCRAPGRSPHTHPFATAPPTRAR